MIELREVSRSFRDGREELKVLHEVDWTIQSGESVALMGRSGSGKSTLLNLIGALDQEFSGSVGVNGKKLETLNERERARFRNEEIGFIFQSFHLMDQLTCLENVLLPSWFSNKATPQEERARGLLRRVGLEAKMNTPPHRLSGGERQRVAIARALIQKPSILLCDEPTGNLDEETGESILSLFQELHKDEGLTLVLVTHERRTAEIAEKVYSLQDGKISLEGSAET